MTLESTSDYWRIWFYVLEAAGLDVQLVSASQARQLSGRPKTDRLDAMWLARLTEMGLLRPSFVPPAEIRVLRHYTRARTRLTWDRTRCWGRLEKLLEDALIKVSAVASKLTTASAQDMIRAMIAGERDPAVLASLARTRMKAKHGALVQALTGMFSDYHAELAQLLLDQIAFIDTRLARLNILIGEQLATIRAAWGVDAGGAAGPGAGLRGHRAARGRPAGRGHRHQRRPGRLDHLRDWPGHDPVPDGRPPGVLDRAVGWGGRAGPSRRPRTTRRYSPEEPGRQSETLLWPGRVNHRQVPAV